MKTTAGLIAIGAATAAIIWIAVMFQAVLICGGLFTR